ncbi:hypothetical protein M3Y94_00052100 [Aphelenchoides besseyi]|nr:hypothetical protein M3Y94_00052100 [Aphelenchoides besseyi]
MRLFVLILVFVLLAVIPVKVETTLSKAVRRAFINSTNLVRSNVAMGKQLNSNGTFLPSAKNFYKLGYNIQLEAEAEKWVSNCVYTFPVVKNVAGNAVKIFGLQTINESLADKIVQTWLSSVARSGLQSLNLTARDNSTLRSFVQMTWGSVQEIGCAIKQCPSLRATLGVCLYSPANVKVGKLIYQKGAYCKKRC